MLLLRLIVFLLICYGLVIVIRSLIGRGRNGAATRLKRQADGEDMVLDPQCRSYVPKSAAVIPSGRYFCSQECARRYLTR
jgi:hypothetical protein